MKIFIPSRARGSRQITMQYLPRKWRNRTILIVPSNEKFMDIPYIQTPPEVEGIAETRQFIIDSNHNEKVFMMDDDLHFHTRKNGKLEKAQTYEVGAALDMMEKWLDEMPCVGFSSRYGNNWIKEDYVECYRPCMAYGLDTSTLKEHNIKFNDLNVCEDYHVFLSLLKLGYKNRMTAKYTVTSPSVNKDGGCAEYRTAEMVHESMNRFVEKHKPYASLRQTKGDTQGFKLGKELRIKWKRAYKDGKAKREIQ